MSMPSAAACVGVEGDAHFVLAAAVGIRLGDARDAFDAGLHDFAHEVGVAGHRPLIARLAGQREPGDLRAETVLAGVDARLRDVGRIARHLVEAVDDLDQRALQVGVDGEHQVDIAATTRGRGLHFLEPRNAAQGIFLRLDDLRFDFLGRRRAPAGADLDERLLHVRDHLNGQADHRHGAHQHNQQYGSDDRDRI